MKTLIMTLAFFLLASLASAQTFSQELSLLGKNPTQVLTAVPDANPEEGLGLVKENDNATGYPTDTVFAFLGDKLHSITWASTEPKNINQVLDAWYDSLVDLDQPISLFVQSTSTKEWTFGLTASKGLLQELLGKARKGDVSGFIVRTKTPHGILLSIYVIVSGSVHVDVLLEADDTDSNENAVEDKNKVRS